MQKELETLNVDVKNLAGSIVSVLPLRDIVVFPRMIAPIFVGREKSIQSLEEVTHNDNYVVLVTQKDSIIDDPEPKDMFSFGVLANIMQLLRLPDGTVKILVEGLKRVKIVEFINSEASFKAKIDILEDKVDDEFEAKALARSVAKDFEKYARVNKKIPSELIASISQLEDPSRICDLIVANLEIKLKDKQKMLETTSVNDRLEKTLGFMEGETSILNIEKRIRSRVKKQMEKTQKEYYLHEQIKAIQKELGDSSQQGDEFFDFEKRIEKAKLPAEALEKAKLELKKLSSISVMSPESSILRNYLDWLLSLPWGKKSKIKCDLDFAQSSLDKAHFGLEEVKLRVVEYLAVQNRANKIKGSILCLVGPPGVGKTSLARSIAKATGREYVKIALGGVRDEAEIRGHRRTYIGAMPGKIIQSMKKAKKSNPLFLLDEIDKMGKDFRGDPASALLEVLDPEQNRTYVDHYLEVEYDLSDVMFITTANTLDMPAALLDRMEIIRLSGYSEEEKLEIAKKYLLPKMLKEHVLSTKEFLISDEAILNVIQYYTKESGVRSLERELMKLGRKTVTQMLKEKITSVEITSENLPNYLGVKRYRYGQIEGENKVGVVTGLAWTQVGGELLTIEGVLVRGKGKMIITGNLRDVMKESISAASSYVRSKAGELGIDEEIFEKHDIHVHVPEGATPKDGPSAGIAMFTTIVSILTGIPIHKDIAMTGEITLRGRVLPIGGLKEKLLAAKRGGIKTVLIPEDNVKDLVEISENTKKDINIIPVSHANQVLGYALTKPIKMNEDDLSEPFVPKNEQKEAFLSTF